MAKEEDSLLPALPGEELDISAIEVPLIPDFAHNTAISSIRKNDLELATMGLKVVAECWQHANSFGRVMRLLKETREGVKFRREVLGLEYGTKSSSTGRDDLTPID
jgi:hypothetical protein